MKLLLLCLGLTLVCAHHGENHDIVTSNFDMSKISGEWYTILLASDIKETIEENSVMRGFVESIQASDNSPMEMKLYIRFNGECVETTLICEPIQNGVCNTIYAGFATMTLIEADYSDYLIFHIINFTTQETANVMMLYARNPDVSPQIKKRFEELCQKYGIPKENVVDLTNADRCLHARGSHGAQASSGQ
ncbi:salivary lipocalin-like [Phyllostomus hastatus]|uniref:salivary lipocalin-like n=1 Tax=Phyllostomus hastatus TaxID=9423 RepID=UPI001E6839AF|nr:salivary lipocalin-like [Phyllostomus hastatus]XP_045696504.1 salivary lipocalin-like [Phyllostomus hastatus]